MRGHDVYIISDCFNYGVTYNMYGMQVPMSPDDHFQDLKRVIGAIGGKARRISVIMPMLYEGRQHKRTARESLDCALALQELVNMGVANIITFDAHDSRVQNAIPLAGFDNVRCTYQMIKALCRNVPDIKLDRDHLAVVSRMRGGMGHACTIRLCWGWISVCSTSVATTPSSLTEPTRSGRTSISDATCTARTQSSSTA
ncbi:MAG: ribose-phosphate pyrophosphokinase-like domain-containing protein [Eubacteriales bacterium]